MRLARYLSLFVVALVAVTNSGCDSQEPTNPDLVGECRTVLNDGFTDITLNQGESIQAFLDDRDTGARVAGECPDDTFVDTPEYTQESDGTYTVIYPAKCNGTRVGNPNNWARRRVRPHPVGGPGNPPPPNPQQQACVIALLVPNPFNADPANPVSTFARVEDAQGNPHPNATLTYHLVSGQQVTVADVYALGTGTHDITVRCRNTQTGAEGNPITFSFVLPGYTGPVANEDRMPTFDAGTCALVENLDDDQNSPTDPSNNLLQIVRTDFLLGVNVTIGNYVVVGNVVEFVEGVPGTLTQACKNAGFTGRAQYRYWIQRTSDGAEAYAFTREDPSGLNSDGTFQVTLDGMLLTLEYIEEGRYRIVERSTTN